MRRRPLRVEIGEIVLDGFAEEHGPSVSEALERELDRRMPAYRERRLTASITEAVLHAVGANRPASQGPAR